MAIINRGKSIAQVQQEFRRFMASAPTIVGTEAVKFYKQSFRRQGFIDDGGVERWEPRKRGDRKDGSRRRSSSRGRRSRWRGLLVQSGRLRRSIRITRRTRTHVQVGTDVPYAKAHNYGHHYRGRQLVRSHWRRYKTRSTKVRAHSRAVDRKLEARQFIGESAFLNRRLQLQMQRRLKQIFTR